MFKDNLKNFLKHGLMLGLYGVSVILPKRRTPVIIYHSVDESGSCITIGKDVFENQMALIKEGGYRTLTFSEIADIWKNGKAEPEKAVVLTFDDGFRNNYDVAFPILRKNGFTATIFLATDYIGKRCTWDKRSDIPDFPMLTWEMITEMGGYGIDFQPHTATHPHLPLISNNRIRDEIKRSRSTIEDKLDKRCDIFCYPYGEFDERVIRVLKEEGFIGAVAVNPDKENLYTIRRVGSMHLTTQLAFNVALKEGFSLYYSCKELVRKITMT